RLLLVMTIVALGATAAAAWLWTHRGGTAPEQTLAELALDDPGVRAAAIRELVARSSGVWDTFADPAVGRLLQPNLNGERTLEGVDMATNGLGLRERPFALPKP